MTAYHVLRLARFIIPTKYKRQAIRSIIRLSNTNAWLNVLGLLG
jgi:hypothetical protein